MYFLKHTRNSKFFFFIHFIINGAFLSQKFPTNQWHKLDLFSPLRSVCKDGGQYFSKFNSAVSVGEIMVNFDLTHTA